MRLNERIYDWDIVRASCDDDNDWIRGVPLVC